MTGHKPARTCFNGTNRLILIPNYATIIGRVTSGGRLIESGDGDSEKNRVIGYAEVAISRFTYDRSRERYGCRHRGSSISVRFVPVFASTLKLLIAHFQSPRTTLAIPFAERSFGFLRIEGVSPSVERFAPKEGKQGVGAYDSSDASSSFFLFLFFFPRLSIKPSFPSCRVPLLSPLSLSPSLSFSRSSPCENWGFAVYQQRRECLTQKTNERATEGGLRCYLEARSISRGVLSFLSFPFPLLSLSFLFFFTRRPGPPFRLVSFSVHELTSHDDEGFGFCLQESQKLSSVSVSTRSLTPP